VKKLEAGVLLTAILACISCGQGAEHDASSDPVPVDPASRVHVTQDSDARAIEIAQSVVVKMGGWDNWDRTRYISYNFFGGRKHHWDRHTGDIRIEGEFGGPEEEKVQRVFLMNVNTGKGRVWGDGQEVTDPEPLAELLKQGMSIWINDSYWVAMPYKLLDPGVTLKHAGEREMEDGRLADVLDLTFTDVGDTPENRYEVFVARDTGLVEQWAFFGSADDEEPRFTMPWKGWEPFGDILLATGRGRDRDWNIAVHDELAAAVMTDPGPIAPQ
jgi:hypothetical protein